MDLADHGGQAQGLAFGVDHQGARFGDTVIGPGKAHVDAGQVASHLIADQHDGFLPAQPCQVVELGLGKVGGGHDLGLLGVAKRIRLGRQGCFAAGDQELTGLFGIAQIDGIGVGSRLGCHAHELGGYGFGLLDKRFDDRRVWFHRLPPINV
ncbi:hypothetical protein DESC_460022 [Desulfosarcina cetonica]|nr:hypothetical protein DESC_460022 [Desulfosarcina cetonica]